MLKSVGDRTRPFGTPFLNWRCVDVLFLNVVYALRPLMYLVMVFVCVCMLTVSNDLLMSSATLIVRSGGCFG